MLRFDDVKLKSHHVKTMPTEEPESVSNNSKTKADKDLLALENSINDILSPEAAKVERVHPQISPSSASLYESKEATEREKTRDEGAKPKVKYLQVSDLI